MIVPIAGASLVALVAFWRAMIYRLRDDERAFRKSMILVTVSVFMVAFGLFMAVEMHLPWGIKSCWSYAARIC
jgi:hypothetical protein